MTLESFLVYGYPRLTQALLISWLAALVYARRDLKDAVSPLFGRRQAWAAAAIAAAGAGARLLWAPRAHHAFWDEIEHLNLAMNFFRHGAFAETLVGGLPDFTVFAAPGHWPPVFHVLLSAVFQATGYAETGAFALNLALGALAVPVFTVAIAALWGSAAAGLAAGILLASDPLHFKYSGAGDLTACSTLWISAALLAVAARARLPNRTSLAVLSHLTIAVAVHTRPENALLLPLAYAIWGRLPTARELAVGVATALPLGALLFLNREGTAANFGASAQIARNFLAHAPTNLRVLFEAQPLAWLAAAAAALAPARLLADAPRARLVLLFWFGAYFLVNTAHRFGRFWLPDIDRLAMPALLAVLAGAALALRRLRPQTAAAAALLLAAGSWPGLAARVAVSPGETEKARWLRELAPLVGRDEYVVTFSPASVTSISGRPAVSARFLLSDRAEFEKQRAGPRELVLFQDYWHNIFPEEAARLEKDLRRDYDFRLIASREIEDLDYPLYRLTPKAR